jgi:hypothetical protein
MTYKEDMNFKTFNCLFHFTIARIAENSRPKLSSSKRLFFDLYVLELKLISYNLSFIIIIIIYFCPVSWLQ